jgi:flagellar biosynthesis/type III secretory pathway protein FliH
MTEIELREYFNAILSEKDRAVEMATAEREKAAGALREEQRYAMETAEHEREKAAEALRTGLDRAMQEGDDRLREHITNQVMQINAALISADKLEIARIDAVRTQLTDAMKAAAAAVTKAENATEKRLEGMNEFRAQLESQNSTFMPREVGEAQFNELRRTVAELVDKVSKLA